MKRALILSLAAISLCLLPSRCAAQGVTSVIYLSPAEAAEAKRASQTYTAAQDRYRSARTAWEDFYRSLKAAHPSCPSLDISSDFKLAFCVKPGSHGMNEVESVELTPAEREKAESLYGEQKEAVRASYKATEAWRHYQFAIIARHIPCGHDGEGINFKRPDGSMTTIPSAWMAGIALTPDFRVAVPNHY